MTGINFDRHAEDYTARIDDAIAGFGKRHDFYIRRKADIMLDLLGPEPKSRQAKILDVGCGVGLVHPYLIDHVAELHGTDISTLSLDLAAKGNPKARYKAYDGVVLPHADGAFDCSFAINVMHHVPPVSWERFVSEMARVVRPGGQVVVIEHNPFNPATRWIVRTCELDRGAILLPPRRLRSLFASGDLRDIMMRYVLFTPFEASLFRKLDNALARLPLGAQYVMRGFVSAPSDSAAAGPANPAARA
jgi:SAM-dependent methyltransferase